ncbi:MAG: hypothetical protein C4547_16490 [Phycisphaerales bacterium]|nr:MAG: hypothetical protein C4547_16490 [Phycisphaerales bacterium]
MDWMDKNGLYGREWTGWTRRIGAVETARVDFRAATATIPCMTTLQEDPRSTFQDLSARIVAIRDSL